jgi:hypothetical protein
MALVSPWLWAARSGTSASGHARAAAVWPCAASKALFGNRDCRRLDLHHCFPQQDRGGARAKRLARRR